MYLKLGANNFDGIECAESNNVYDVRVGERFFLLS